MWIHVYCAPKNPILQLPASIPPPNNWNPGVASLIIYNNMAPYVYKPLPSIPYACVRGDGINNLENPLNNQMNQQNGQQQGYQGGTGPYQGGTGQYQGGTGQYQPAPYFNPVSDPNQKKTYDDESNMNFQQPYNNAKQNYKVY